MYLAGRTFLLSLLLAALPLGDALAAEDDVGAWAVVATSGRFGADDRFRYTIDAQARYFDIGTGINQWLLRPGLGMDLTADTSAWIGYARFRTRGRSGQVVNENRYWQDLRWDPAFDNGGRLAIRFRFEQRDVDISDDVRVLVRTMARYTFPQRQASSTRFFLAAETFVDLNTTDWGGGTGISQYRFLAGVGWPVGGGIRVDTGYMQQHFRIDDNENLLNHLAFVAVRF